MADIRYAAGSKDSGKGGSATTKGGSAPASGGKGSAPVKGTGGRK